MPDPTTHDITCIAPILETGQRIPGFVQQPDTKAWLWNGPHETHALDEAPEAARNAAIGWLTEWCDSMRFRCNAITRDGMFLVGCPVKTNRVAHGPSRLEALCTAWLKENSQC